MGFIFCMQINIKVGTVVFDGSSNACPKYPSRQLVIFSQYIKKKVSQLLMCSILMQNIQIFYGRPVIHVPC